MHLAFYAGIVETNKTGVGVYLTHLLRELIALRPDADYTSFVPSVRRARQHRAGLQAVARDGPIHSRTVPVPARALHWSEMYLRLPPMRALLGRPYDVFHQMGVVTDPVVPAHKLVVSLFDTVSLHWPGDEAPLPARTGPLLRRAAAILTLSEHARRDIIRVFAVAPDHVHVIPGGLDHDRYHPHHAPAAVEATLAWLGVRRPYLFYVGGQPPRKNLPRLIAAFARARQAGDLPHTLVLAGPIQPLRPEIAAIIAASGAADAVQVLGYVADDALPHLYRGADALLFPSLYEGFGLPVIEALASGTPVLTSATTSLPEVAGDAALLVDPASEEAIAAGILTLLGERAEVRAGRVDRALAQADRFSWRACAAQHLAVYDAVRAGGR